MSSIEPNDLKVQTRPIRKPRPKPIRRARLSEPIHANGARLLVLSVGELSVGYHLEPIPSDFGRGYKLTKFAEGGGDPDEREYDVHLSPDTGHTDCTCKGGTYRAQRCKHQEAIIALTLAGKLS